MPYHRRVMTMYSPKWQKNICFTLPSGIDSKAWDIHFVEAEKLASHPLLNAIHHEYQGGKSQPYSLLLNQYLTRFFGESQAHPMPMPSISCDGNNANLQYQCSVFSGRTILCCLNLGIKRFPVCIRRGPHNPDIISAALKAFRKPEPATAWESYSGEQVVHKAGYSYAMTACHPLSFLSQRCDHAISNYTQWASQREALAIQLRRGKPGDYDAAHAVAIQLQKSGVDPDLEPDLRWHAPDIVAYRALLDGDERAAGILGNLKKVEACRRYVHLLQGIGDLSIEMPEPYDWGEQLKVFEAQKPRIDAALRDNPTGAPMELVRRYHLLTENKEKRQKEIFAGARLDDVWEGAEDETIANLDSVLLPLAGAIKADSKAAEIARSVLRGKALAYLETTAPAPQAVPSLAFLAGQKGGGPVIHPGGP